MFGQTVLRWLPKSQFIEVFCSANPVCHRPARGAINAASDQVFRAYVQQQF